MDEPVNVDDLETADLRSTSSDDAEWVGGYFAYGGSGANDSCVIYFAVPPGNGSAGTRTPRRRRSSSSAGAGSYCSTAAPSR
jgi:hypothetical protein